MQLVPFDTKSYPIVVAIDFGTTFSGCAYAFEGEDIEILDIVKWPKQTIQYPKTPTMNFYKKEMGENKLVAWGWQSRIEASHPKANYRGLIQQYKLLLDEQLEQAADQNEFELTAVEVISDYLESFHDYVSKEILRSFGANFRKNHFRYCLTVPAMWSDRAKNVMRQAAIRAKMIKESDHPDRLLLVSEPEAAAVYCEHKFDQFKLESGDQFMVCDAGGGTVDLIVFEVTRTSAGRTLSEVTKGHGASCGSVFLDRRFRTLLEDRFKKQDVSISAVTISQMVDTFANEIKPHFDEKEDQYLRLTARWNLDATSNHAALGIEEDSMVFTGQELKEHVFDPVVEDVIKLIEIQLLQAPKCSTIFLVGGFGSSDYLSRRIRKQLEPRGLKILVPPRPELAIVRGAVHVGLNPKVVTARISRRFYGVETNEPFEQDKDPESTRVEEVSGSWCQKRFTCFVTKAEKLKIDQCVVREFAALKWSEIPQDFAIPLLSCDDGVSPPRHTTASGVTRLAKVCIPWPFAISDEIGKEIKVVVKMYFGLNEIKAVASIDDKDYGATIKFDAIDSY